MPIDAKERRRPWRVTMAIVSLAGAFGGCGHTPSTQTVDSVDSAVPPEAEAPPSEAAAPPSEAASGDAGAPSERDAAMPDADASVVDGAADSSDAVDDDAARIDGGDSSDAGTAEDASDASFDANPGDAAYPTFAILGTGADHTCGVTTAGALWCWGANVEGQLGSGSTTSTDRPVPVMRLDANVTAVAGGDEHTCAVAASALQCWGDDEFGELGDDAVNQQLAPVPVQLPAGVTVTALAVGDSTTCAITTTSDAGASDAGGALMCWGDDTYGTLGTAALGTAVQVPSPVTGLSSGVMAVTAAERHQCALTVAGGVKCWGDNAFGDLGIGNTYQQDSPVDVPSFPSGVASIAAGSSFTCAVTTAGAATCWGANSQGQLGNGTTTESDVPVGVTGLTSGVAAVAAGNDHACALTQAGAVVCWGDGAAGELGNGANLSSSTPVAVSGLSSGVVAIAAAHADHTCALTAAGYAVCWGSGRYGQLGSGTAADSNVPAFVVAP